LRGFFVFGNYAHNLLIDWFHWYLITTEGAQTSSKPSGVRMYIILIACALYETMVVEMLSLF